jgi:hypothetical protein
MGTASLGETMTTNVRRPPTRREGPPAPGRGRRRDARHRPEARGRLLTAGAAVLTAVAVAVTACAWFVTAPAVSAQTYPPPVRSITVDDPTPAPGQTITVRLRTCRAGTTALIGVGLTLAAAPRVDAQGVATAQFTLPSRIRAGRHIVLGACLAPDRRPLVLTTTITVARSAAGGGAAGGGAAGGGAAGDGAAGGGAAGDGAAVALGPGGDGDAAGGGGATGGGSAPSLAPLGGATAPAPASAATLYEETAATHGVADGPAGAEADERSADGRGASDGPGLLATIARVILGLAAVGGVPVALALSRQPGRGRGRTVQRGFAWP